MLTDYSFYKDVFHGDFLTEDNYEKYAARADAWLDYLTYGAFTRIEAQQSGFNSERTSSEGSELSSCLTEARRSGACEDEDQLTYGKYTSPNLSESVLQKVKMAECALAELCFSMATDAAANPSIEKETVGSHSVTYRGSTDSISGWSARIRETASRYLMSTGLLYRGAILRFKL